MVLYVNQNTRNFQMFRYGRRWHVFINHGESDKNYMISNQFKAYDYAFIAGDAARARLTRVLWDYDVDTRTLEIGRPQADHFTGLTSYTPDDRIVVLYAPTWEGDRPSAHYGSLISHGEALVGALLATGRHRVVYPAASRAGRRQPRVRRGQRADHRRDRRGQRGRPVGPPRATTTVRRTRVAAVGAPTSRSSTSRRWSTTASPPARRCWSPARSIRRRSIDTQGYLARVRVAGASARRRSSPRSSACSAIPRRPLACTTGCSHYFGDTTPGVGHARFHAAVATLMAGGTAWHDAAIRGRAG